LLGKRELSYEERTYDCPVCGTGETGYQVIQKGPPEFLLQPHTLYPMSVNEFAYWLSIFRTHFPDNWKLGALGVSWYPGKELRVQESRLRRVSNLGSAQGYYFSLSNDGPDDERIRVCVQRDHEAHFWVDPTIELDSNYGFDENELDVIRELVRTHEAEIRAGWKRFAAYTRKTQARWLAKIEAIRDV
jgi:hypothetical protein